MNWHEYYYRLCNHTTIKSVSFKRRYYFLNYESSLAKKSQRFTNERWKGVIFLLWNKSSWKIKLNKWKKRTKRFFYLLWRKKFKKNNGNYNKSKVHDFFNLINRQEVNKTRSLVREISHAFLKIHTLCNIHVARVIPGPKTIFQTNDCMNN